MQEAITKRSSDKDRGGITFGILFSLCILISVFFSAELKDAVILGLKISPSTVIPAIFPFFIFSDFLRAELYFSKNGIASKIFERVFKINHSACGAFVCGLICGFPMGIKYATDLYENKEITADEYQRLICFANNPSLAFCISGIGAGIRGNKADGIILYISIIISSVAVAILTSIKKHKSSNSAFLPRQKFVLSKSISEAGFSSVSISSFIIFFCCLINLVKTVVKNEVILIIISAFLEIGTASLYISKSNVFTPVQSMMLTAFALGFSGVSVHLQAFVFMPKEINKTKYISFKFLQGILCALTTLIIYNVIYFSHRIS